MPQHGQIDKHSNQIFCGYWMNIEDWEEIHKYSPNVEEIGKTRKENGD